MGGTTHSDSAWVLNTCLGAYKLHIISFNVKGTRHKIEERNSDIALIYGWAGIVSLSFVNFLSWTVSLCIFFSLTYLHGMQHEHDDSR